MNNYRLNNASKQENSTYNPKRFNPQYRTPAEISLKYDKFLTKQKGSKPEDIQDTPVNNSSRTSKFDISNPQKLSYQANPASYRIPLDSKDEITNYSKGTMRKVIDLSNSRPSGTSDKKPQIGPNNRWNCIQNHYETMNNKENFGGDIDDIEEISEFIDGDSKFVYTSEDRDSDEPEGDIEHLDFNNDLPKHAKTQRNKDPEEILHHNIDLMSSENEGEEYNKSDVELSQLNNSFKVYTVEDETRKVTNEIQKMIEDSNKKSKSSINKEFSDNSSIKQYLFEESKIKPSDNTKKANIKEDNLSKYKVPMAKTKLESVCFSDIVNYESNDEIVSLTGDRKFHLTNHLENKLNSNKSSTVGSKIQNQPLINKALNKRNIIDMTQQQKVQEIKVNPNDQSKDELTFMMK